MAVTVFKDSSYNLTGLISWIEHGDIALPDIQRPFVWSNARVRDLFDSMYKGFPVGYLLLWSTGVETNTKQIGTDVKKRVPALLIVDGQQRLTSLYAVITGTPVVRKDYSEGKIRVAFRPKDSVFEVTDAAIENDPEFIPDISEVFSGSFLSFVTGFLEKLEEYRGEQINRDEKNRLEENIDRLRDIQNYPFQAIELDRTVDEEHVAEVFVRINSEGVQLNNADFILTLMSVFWEEGRKKLEAFARAAKTSPAEGSSPFNHFIDPAPDQLLRAAVGLAFRRGRLQYVYAILRGKDLETGQFSVERREAQFEKLQGATEYALDLTNWHEYLKCLKQAGYLSHRMISSGTALMYVYTIWLVGRKDFGVDLKALRDVISRWWFMSHTTGRYTGSSETQMESDLNRIRDLPEGDGDAFCSFLDKIVRDTFTNDYWDISLPNRLDTASAKSPALSAYWAALNLLEAKMLFSDLRVSGMLDPAVTPVKDMERHHLFPKAHLRSLGIRGATRVNKISNMAFVDWSDNLAISDTAPSDYWPTMTEGMSDAQVKEQSRWHALPIGWEQLDYDSFIEKRARLISRVVKDGFETLMDESEATVHAAGSVVDLIADGESHRVEFKERARWGHGTDMKGKSEQVIAKTVSGFMNSEGGTLLIGVADDKMIVGLESDYSTLSKGNQDGYELFLAQLISNKISGPSSALCRISFHKFDDGDVCRINVAPSAKPVFTCPMNNKEHLDFWVRQGNRTEQFRGPEQSEYISEHWG